MDAAKEWLAGFVATGRAHGMATVQPLLDSTAERGERCWTFAYTEARVLCFVVAEQAGPHVEQAGAAAKSSAQETWGVVRPFVESNLGSMRRTIFGQPPKAET